MKKNNTTITLLQGRLGNQLFEYAFARARAFESGSKCVLSEAPLTARGIQNRLDCFVLSPDVEFVDHHTLSWRQYIGMSLYAHLVQPHSRIKRYELEEKLCWLWEFCGLFLCENGYIIPPSGRHISNKDFICVGYMQSEKFFYNQRKQILSELSFKQNIYESVKDMAEKIKSSNEPTCLHVRLGDYVKNPLHGVLDAAYYRRALDEMRRYRPNATIFVFSDNVELVREELNLQSDVYYISPDIDEQQTMYLGSLCKNFIISNSSFSWWMQYLSRWADKLVLAPSRWYASECPCDIYLKDWVLLNV